jgi:hypothetical protein
MAKIKQVQPTNDGVSNVVLRDCISALKNEVIFPLVALADLLTNTEPVFAFADQRKTLMGIGKLLSLLAEKAECILRDYSVEA